MVKERIAKETPKIAQVNYINPQSDMLTKLSSYAIGGLTMVIGLAAWFGGNDYFQPTLVTALLLICYELATIREAVRQEAFVGLEEYGFRKV